MLKSVIQHLVFSNVYIACAAVALYAATNVSFGLAPVHIDDPVLYLVFFSTLAIYSLLRLIGLNKDNLDANSELMSWVRAHQQIVIAFTVVSVVAATYCFLQLPLTLQFVVGLASVISLMYAFPMIPGSRNFKRLREVTFAKAIIVALAWTLMTSLVPLLWHGGRAHFLDGEFYWAGQIGGGIIALHGTIRFLFILGITLPFDIRDVGYDRQDGLKTVANQFGIFPTKAISVALLLLSGLLSILFASKSTKCIAFFHQSSPTFAGSITADAHAAIIAIMSLASLTMAIMIIARLKNSSKERAYTLWLDGTMILQFILMLGGLMLYSLVA